MIYISVYEVEQLPQTGYWPHKIGVAIPIRSNCADFVSHCSTSRTTLNITASAETVLVLRIIYHLANIVCCSLGSIYCKTIAHTCIPNTRLQTNRVNTFSNDKSRMKTLTGTCISIWWHICLFCRKECKQIYGRRGRGLRGGCLVEWMYLTIYFSQSRCDHVRAIGRRRPCWMWKWFYV